MVPAGTGRNKGERRMRKLLGLAFVGLAACNSEPEVSLKNATPEQVAAEVRKSAPLGEMRFDPGEWRIESRMQDVVGEGMPPQVLQQMKASMAGVTSQSQCLTPEQASRPSSEMFAGKQRGNCKYETFEMSGGKLKATLSCPDRSGAKMAMTMDGSYSKTSYTVDADMRIDSPTPGQNMTIRMRSTGTRVGECPAAS
jgi:hypothetical protein